MLRPTSADEVRSIDGLGIELVQVGQAELKLATQLIEQIAIDAYDPTQFVDEEKERILAAVERKIAGKEIVVHGQSPPLTSGEVLDLMEALRKSLVSKSQTPSKASPVPVLARRTSQARPTQRDSKHVARDTTPEQEASGIAVSRARSHRTASRRDTARFRLSTRGLVVPRAADLESTHIRYSLVRLHGRNADTWNLKGAKSAAERFNYDYSDAELTDIASRVERLSPETFDTHVVMNNNFEDQGQRNAASLVRILDERHQARVPKLLERVARKKEQQPIEESAGTAEWVA